MPGQTDRPWLPLGITRASLLLALVIPGLVASCRIDAATSIDPASARPSLAAGASVPTTRSTPSSPPATGELPASSFVPPAALGVPSRVVIGALGIDLPVVAAPAGADAYPFCNVAMYLPQLHRPGEAGATYVFAHARTGMFLPLLDESRVRDGARMIGMRVDVYTADDRLFTYSIVAVHRHVLTLEDAIREADETLYLQTSEGPHGTPQKLQLVADPISSGAATEAAAQPTPHPLPCE